MAVVLMRSVMLLLLAHGLGPGGSSARVADLPTTRDPHVTPLSAVGPTTAATSNVTSTSDMSANSTAKASSPVGSDRYPTVTTNASVSSTTNTSVSSTTNASVSSTNASVSSTTNTSVSSTTNASVSFTTSSPASTAIPGSTEGSIPGYGPIPTTALTSMTPSPPTLKANTTMSTSPTSTTSTTTTTTTTNRPSPTILATAWTPTSRTTTTTPSTWEAPVNSSHQAPHRTVLRTSVTPRPLASSTSSVSTAPAPSLTLPSTTTGVPTASTRWRTVPSTLPRPAATSPSATVEPLSPPHEAALRPAAGPPSTPASASRGSLRTPRTGHHHHFTTPTPHRKPPSNATSRTPPTTRPPSARERPFVEEIGVVVMAVTSPPLLDNDSAPDGWNGTYFNDSCRNYTNDYCVPDEEYLDMMLEYIMPTKMEWVIIAMHCAVFIGGLVGNALVCLAVYRNHTMRTVTNYFIVNLAVADFLVILMCLPPTVLWDVTETWFMGTALCKIVLYFQTVSVTVSVLTLTTISVDRWYAICFPLKFKSTTSRAKKAIIIIWLLALSFDVPELVVLETKRKALGIDTIFFTQCLPTWGDSSETTYHCVKTLFLFFLPLAFMTVTYVQIVKVLWSKTNIPGHAETKSLSYQYCNGNGVSGTRRTMHRSISASSQILSRRKAAKMLVVVVLMFFICYLPVHLLSILRYTMIIPQTELMTVTAMFVHWLCYANSAVNPLIYNFMSGKFRGEFRLAFQQCACESWVLGGDTVRPAAGGGGPGGGPGPGALAGVSPGHVVLGMSQLHRRPAPRAAPRAASTLAATATTTLSVSVLDSGP
ncbi:uncharacterized protein LOC113208546 isoform X2 [Frankliniella occidentalis]|uniref:Uncharacterized protein LOC113208546 isoform X2 n=1 Tax=Frankliniella occidentalis TaxID=133901 RepID=A0A9C6X1C9_FRAOC|nr:uncharacterized protein LOC113208546 isoform X2 [Frankliniella occidentalis]